MWHHQSGAGQPLVLLHGFPLDHRIWSCQIPALEKHARVIAPDLPGFGNSHSQDSFTIESLADDLHALLTKLAALPCHLAGLSMGGYVCLAFAKKYPTDLLSLILIDTKAESDTEAQKQSRNEMIDLAGREGSVAIAAAMLPRLIAPNTPKENLLPILLDCPPLTIQHALAAMRDRPDQHPLLATLKMPVHIVVGDLDVITPPATARAMAAQIPNSRLTIIANSGHLSPYESPSAVTDAILSWLTIQPPNRYVSP